MSLEKIFQRIGLIIILILISALPTFFLPLTSNWYENNKNVLLFAGVLLASLAWTGSMIVAKKVRLTLSPFNLPLVAITASWLLSTILRSPNKLEAFLNPNQTGTTVLLCLLFFLITNLITDKEELSVAVSSLFAGFSLTGIVNILWSSGLKMPFLNSTLWSPMGSPVTTIVVNFVIIAMAVVLIIKSLRIEIVTGIAAVGFLISLTAGILFSYRLFSTPDINLAFMSQTSAWTVALDVLKSSPFLGSGPGSYNIVATRFRPVSDNLDKNWNIRFGAPSNYYLELVTVLGLTGLAAYLLFAYQAVRLAVVSLKEKISSESAMFAIGVMILLVVHLFLPATFITSALIFILAGLLVASIKIVNTHTHLVCDTDIEVITANNSAKTPVLPWIIITLLLAAAIPSAVVWTQVYVADVYYQQAMVAANANDGKTTYTKLISAINFNPYKDLYRSTYSQTNFLLASSLSNKKDLSDQEKKTVNDLVQTAIAEGKQAISLNSLRASNAEGLANLYSNLIKIAQDADKWAVAAYRQAIILDPTNPNLRIVLGGVMFKLENYDEATRLFIEAVNLKPDLANAYYNLANAYKQTKAYEQAAAAMREVIRLVDIKSNDYTKASEELAELEKMIPKKPEESGKKESSQLTRPDENTAPKVFTPVNLDKSLSPETPATPASKPATIN